MNNRTGDVAAGVATVVEDISGRRFARARESEMLEDGMRAILVPRFDGRILGRLLMPRLKKPFFRIRLDRLGTVVWESIDGRATVGEIAAGLAGTWPDMEMPLERVALFVRTLAIQGHVVEVDGPDACESGGSA